MKYFIYIRKSTESAERQVMSLESQLSELKEFAAKEKLEIVLSAPVPAFTQEFRSGRQGEAGRQKIFRRERGRGGRGVWGEFRPPSPASSVRIFSNRHLDGRGQSDRNGNVSLLQNLVLLSRNIRAFGSCKRWVSPPQEVSVAVFIKFYFSRPARIK